MRVTTSPDYTGQIIALITNMPVDRLREVYEFVRMKSFAEEDAKWEQAFAETPPDQWVLLADELMQGESTGIVVKDDILVPAPMQS
ncbi:MAG: hypothetical protein KIH69_022365 [Anaerolineae bacterium]|nr:hypothetical protein [Anaerolineae bacterium]